MNQKKFINEFRENDRIDQVFWLSQKELRPMKNGKFINLKLSDKTGSLEGKIWDNAEEVYDRLITESFIQVQGEVTEHNKKLQIKVHSFKPVKDDDVNLEDFTPHTPKDIDLLWAQLTETMDALADPYLKKLINLFLSDQKFIGVLRKSPAAIKLHHAYVGGLLEHIVNILNLGKSLSAYYPVIKQDLLLVGIFLHDIGKMKEYSIKIMPDQTDEGRLIGHTSLGILILEEKTQQIKDFPTELLMELRHLILSHHGEYEFGAPVLPMTPEALMLHYLDNLDAKMGQYQSLREHITDPEERWSEWSNALERRLYLRKNPQ
ncbi:MAG: HD domain-containing protein [Planctomycetota bacterium]